MNSKRDTLAALAADLASTLIAEAAGHLHDLGLDDPQQQTLRNAWEVAFGAMLERVVAGQEDHCINLVKDVFRRFLVADGVIGALLDLALEGRDPPLILLGDRFNALDFDRATLPVDINATLFALTHGLADALLKETAQSESQLQDRVSVGRLLAISSLLHDRQNTLASIDAQIARVEAPSGHTVYNIFIQNARGLAIGDQATAQFDPELHELVMQVLGTLNQIQAERLPRYIHTHYPVLEDYVYNFTEVIQSATHWFVGRRFVFAAVERFLSTHPCGYLHIFAEAGLGKTAIAAQLVKRYDAPAFFFDITRGITSPERCLKHLCVQIIARYGLSYDHLPAHAGEDEGFLSGLLSEAAQGQTNGQPILIVLDALDEAEPTPPGHNWLHLPPLLPQGVYFVLTHRPGHFPLRTSPPVSVEELQIAWNSSHQKTDIEAHLRRQGSERPEIRRVLEEASPPISLDDFVRVLGISSEGNFMYLSYVLEDIAGREPGDDPLYLEGLPRGLDGYYSQLWEQMEHIGKADGRTEWREFYRPVIELLGAAQEPVTVNWLADHLGRDPCEVREDALRHWQRFLRVEYDDGVELWSIIHRSFADFVAAKLDLSAARLRIVDYYLRELSHLQEHSGYAFRHLAAHDVRPALDDALAQGLGGLPRALAYGLLRGTLTTGGYAIRSDQLEQMIASRRAEEIFEWAATFPDGDWYKIDLTQAAGEVAALAGQTDRAIQMLRQAANLVVNLRPFLISQYLKSIALDLAILGDEEGIELTLTIAQQIPVHPLTAKSETINALSHIQECLQRGVIDQLLSPESGYQRHPAIERLRSERYTRRPPLRFLYAAEQSARAWASWASVLHQCGDRDRAGLAFAKAQSAVDLMGEEQHQAKKARALGKLAEVAVALAQPREVVSRLLEEAITATEHALHYIEGIDAQVFLANLAAKLGYREHSLRLLKRISEQFRSGQPQEVYRAMWLARLAPCLECLNNAAVLLCEFVRDESLRKTVAQIWLVHSGDIDLAQSLLNELEQLEQVDAVYSSLARSLFAATIPLLQTQSGSERLLEQVLNVSRHILAPSLSWLDWLEEMLTAVQLDAQTAASLSRILQEIYEEATPDVQVRLALSMIPLLAHLHSLDAEWVIDLVRCVFGQERPYHRFFALQAIEGSAPLVLKVAGPQAVIETWDYIQYVEPPLDKPVRRHPVGMGKKPS